MIDTAVLWVRAEAAMRARRFSEALGHLRKLVQVVDRIDFEYEEWLRALAACLEALGEGRQAAACAAYLGVMQAPAAGQLRAQVDAARDDAQALRGLRLMGVYLSRSGLHGPACEWFEAAQMPVHLAIELERAGRDAEAIAVWTRVLEDDRLRDRPYESALVRLNLALCLERMGDERARAALAEAIGAVEQAADAFETEGLRERAFDCFQLLARVGQEVGAFENVAEGYLNSVRVLRDDALKLDALRLYQAFITLAGRAEEFHAVAVVLREAADYCTRVGLPYADDLRWRAGDAWVRAAEEAQQARLPVQVVANAYLAAAEAYASVRAFRQVAAVYTTLSELEPSSRGRQRYRRLLERLGPEPRNATRPLAVPDHLKQLPEYEEVWYVDLAEWELDGDPSLVAAGVMADRRFPDFVRRHALLLVLEVERAGGAVPLVEVVRRLQSIRAYPVIAALEQLYARGDSGLRREVARAVGSLRFKRSFGLLDRALRDPDPSIRAEAAEALSGLFFPHAFDRLRRVYEARDLPEADNARLAALKAIGRINSVDALDFLVDRLREGSTEHAAHARNAIDKLSNPELAPYLRQQIDLVPAEHRAVLEDTAQRLGGR